MPDRLPPLRLTVAERFYLAAELDEAAAGYADASGRPGSPGYNPSMAADARKLRRLANRMRGAPAQPRDDGPMVRLADIPLSPTMEVEPHYVIIDGRARISGYRSEMPQSPIVNDGIAVAAGWTGRRWRGVGDPVDPDERQRPMTVTNGLMDLDTPEPEGDWPFPS